jgi:hypothetical protein
LYALNAKILGNATFDAKSSGLFEASHVDNPTERLDILCVATFVKPRMTQDMGEVPGEMVAEPESLMTSKGSVDE